MAYESTPAVNRGGFVSGKEQHSTTHDRQSGTNQRQPQPNENIANRPLSSPAFGKHADDSDDAKAAQTETEGVTQGHHHPQQPKHGHGAEGSSSTGLPEGEDSRNPSSDHNPRTKEAHGGTAHGRDVFNQSHTSATADRSS